MQSLDRGMSKQKAGGLIAKGSFGCVYTPPLPCIDSHHKTKQTGKNLVSKVYNETGEMQTEWNISQTIAKIDPAQKYFVYGIDKCNVETKKAEKESKIRGIVACDIVQDVVQKTIPSIVMPNGGLPFHDWLADHRWQISITDLVRIMIPCFEGLQLLLKYGFTHQDIKANNILIDKTYRTRIIDFSFTVKTADVLNNAVNTKYVSRYWVFPPDYRIRKYLAGREKHKVTDSDVMRIILMEDDLLQRTFKSTDVERISHLHRKYFWDDRKEYETQLRDSLQRAASAKSSASAWRPFVSKIDVYSLGLVLLWASQYTSTFMNGNLTKSNEWQAFCHMVRSMTAPDPRKRVTIAQALKLARKF